MHRLTDEELVARYQSGAETPEARALLNELFGRHHAKVAAWCYRMTGDRESAADLAQEIFLKAYRNLHSFRRDSKFTTWLYTVTRNHCTNELRSRAIQPDEAGERELLDLADAVETADTALERGQSAEQLRALLAEVLDETELKVMTLHYAEELPLDAITRLLSLTNASGAKAYIVNAKRKLTAAIARGKHSVLRPASGRRDA